jgi:transposase InsO family protein
VSKECRQQILCDVAEAVEDGSRQVKACEVAGISERTLERWQKPLTSEDHRHGPLTAPLNKLTNEERAKILEVAVSAEFNNLSPRQIVPTLADRGEYVGSESSFYRVLRGAKLLNHRGGSKVSCAVRPKAFEAFMPLQLFSWDITYLPTSVRGIFYYLYLFMDIYSRKAVGWEVHEKESMDYSAVLLESICKAEGVEKHQLTVHADNGGAMKGSTMLVKMQSLGVMPSFSRPSVSDDNPFSESLFKTLKYCSFYPTRPFADIEEARTWVAKFIEWYNNEHLHSGISYTTPSSRHAGQDKEILSKRTNIYEIAKEKNPTRWSSKIRNWEKVTSVKLNWLQEKEMSVTSVSEQLVS